MSNVRRVNLIGQRLEQIGDLFGPGPGGWRRLRIDRSQDLEGLVEAIGLGDRSTGIAVGLALLAPVADGVEVIRAERGDEFPPDTGRECPQLWLMRAEEAAAPFEIGMECAYGVGKRAVGDHVHELDAEFPATRQGSLGDRLLRRRAPHGAVVEADRLRKRAMEDRLHRWIELEEVQAATRHEEQGALPVGVVPGRGAEPPRSEVVVPDHVPAPPKRRGHLVVADRGHGRLAGERRQRLAIAEEAEAERCEPGVQAVARALAVRSADDDRRPVGRRQEAVGPRRPAGAPPGRSRGRRGVRGEEQAIGSNRGGGRAHHRTCVAQERGGVGKRGPADRVVDAVDNTKVAPCWPPVGTRAAGRCRDQSSPGSQREEVTTGQRGT